MHWKEKILSILKAESVYRHKTTPFSDANEMIDHYITLLKLPVYTK